MKLYIILLYMQSPGDFPRPSKRWLCTDDHCVCVVIVKNQRIWEVICRLLRETFGRRRRRRGGVDAQLLGLVE